MAELNDLERVRLEKAEALRRAGMEPYPTTAVRTHTTVEAQAAFEGAPESEPVLATVVGRLRSIRRMGKVTFAHVEDGHGRLQLYLRADDLGAEKVALFADLFDLGDFV
jgi:lysyl-tRNA synthetase class 2